MVGAGDAPDGTCRFGQDLFADEQGEAGALGKCAEQQARVASGEKIGVDGRDTRVEGGHRVISPQAGCR
ncbi:MAG: hypothetical protein OXU81_15675 [Gammaproteobacteria bacterium]|nr:hypothetical protein [Gammaproteobacteria bacterium]